MKITVNNRIGFSPVKIDPETNKRIPDYRRAKDVFLDMPRRFPTFQITKDISYNGVVVEVDDEDVEDFTDALDMNGLSYEVEEVDGGFTTPKWPKGTPRFPKGAPRWPKSVPKLEKVVPKWPRAYKPFKVPRPPSPL